MWNSGDRAGMRFCSKENIVHANTSEEVVACSPKNVVSGRESVVAFSLASKQMNLIGTALPYISQPVCAPSYCP